MSDQKPESTSKQKLSKLVLKSVRKNSPFDEFQKFYLEIVKIALGIFFNLERFAYKLLPNRAHILTQRCLEGHREQP